MKNKTFRWLIIILTSVLIVIIATAVYLFIDLGRSIDKSNEIMDAKMKSR